MPSSNITRSYPEERRLATVLFADVQGFTALAERLDYEVVGDLLQEIWTRLDEVIEKEGGYIDKHLGDGVMAVWGAPFASETDAEHAIEAGLALQTSLDALVADSTIAGACELKLRVGVNSGPVLASYVGIHNEYTVIGDTVNVASRLEQNAPPGDVVIGESTYHMVRNLYRFRRLEPMVLKGKTEPFQAYIVEGPASSLGKVRYQSEGGLETCLVAREVELSRLEHIFEETSGSDCPVMALITGEPGLGKSRLIMEFANHLESEHSEVVVFSVRALAQTSHIPFHVWKILLHTYFGLRDDDSEAEAGRKFQAGIARVWSIQTSETLPAEAIHILGNMTGLKFPDSPYLQAYEENPGSLIQRAHELMRELLVQISAEHSLVLLIDDMQWADQSSLDMLYALLQPCHTSLHALVLGGTRIELLRQQPRWANLANVLHLKPLPIRAEIVSSAYPKLHVIPNEVLIELISKADGNPYFLEEMVKSLVKSGALEQNLSANELLDQMRIRPPESLSAMLQARLDGLTKEVRTVALLASVCGRVFWVGAIKAALRASNSMGTGQLMQMPIGVVDRVIQDSLRQLVIAELAFPRAGSKYSDQQEYIFKHSLLREVAYSLIPLRHRPQYHQAVAQWLAHYPDPDYKVMAAEHFEEAGAFFEALQYYRVAAEFARSRGLTVDADALLARARLVEESQANLSN